VTLAVTAATEECYSEWRLEVNLLVEGEQQTLVIDDEGEPFRTSAMVENPINNWIYYTSWVRCGGVEEPDEVFC
jgi:hypothetical protein